ncbi:MAG: hypothetical protein U1F77_01580 [Kiritimatiellia bacterium]
MNEADLGQSVQVDGGVATLKDLPAGDYTFIPAIGATRSRSALPRASWRTASFLFEEPHAGAALRAAPANLVRDGRGWGSGHHAYQCDT